MKYHTINPLRFLLFSLTFLLIGCDKLVSIRYIVQNNSDHMLIIRSARDSYDSPVQEFTIEANEEQVVFLHESIGSASSYQERFITVPNKELSIISPNVVLQFDPSYLKRWEYHQIDDQNGDYILSLNNVDFQ